MQVLLYSYLSVAVKNSVSPGGETEKNKENIAPRIPPMPYSLVQSSSTATTQINVDHSTPLELNGPSNRQNSLNPWSHHHIDTEDEVKEDKVEELTSELKRIRV